MKRNILFRNYISTHFEGNTDLSDDRVALEYSIFDRNFKNLLPQNRNIRILEIGFGTGFFLKFLLANGYKNIYGIDLSYEVVEFVKKHIYSNVECVENTEDFLEKHKGEYDFVFMLDVLEHIPKNETINFLIKVKDALSDSGTLVIRVPNASSPFNINTFGSDFTHEFIYTTNSLVQVNKIAGFKNVDVFPCKEENISWHGRITNVTQRFMFFFIKLLVGLCRNDLDATSFYTKNIYCICKKRS